MKPTTALIIETDKPQADRLISLLTELDLTVPRSVFSYDDAIRAIEKNRPCIVFLNIRLNEVREGIDLAYRITNEYGIPYIFTCLENEQELVKRTRSSTETHCLVKPFNKNRLEPLITEACAKFKWWFQNKQDEGFLFMEKKDVMRRIRLQELFYFKTDHVYIDIHTTRGKFLIRSTMSGMFKLLNNDPRFFQINRGCGINLNLVDEVHRDHVIINGQKLPVSKPYRSVLQKKLKWKGDQ